MKFKYQLTYNFFFQSTPNYKTNMLCIYIYIIYTAAVPTTKRPVDNTSEKVASGTTPTTKKPGTKKRKFG